MISAPLKISKAGVGLGLLALGVVLLGAGARAATPKQRSLDEWRSLTRPTSELPEVFVKGSEIRLYFRNQTNVMEFSAHWSHGRVPTDGYKVSSALLRLNRRLSHPPAPKPGGWRQATVIAETDWRRLIASLLDELTPSAPGHGVCFQAFLADRVMFRDAHGIARLTSQTDAPPDLVIDHRFPTEETLEVFSRHIEGYLLQHYPGDSLFLIMAPNADQFMEPLLLDHERHRCIWLSPASLYDTMERGSVFANSMRGCAAVLFESHGLALIKNPVSSAARLVDLGVQTGVKILQFPLPKPVTDVPPLARTNGMDLVAWEKWLDRNTGTRQEKGSLQLLIDGDRFYSRLTQAIAAATNHIYTHVYIFDRDDVAVAIADQLKQRSFQVRVRVILDQMGTLAAGLEPPATPMPENFTMPASIVSYLRDGSRVRVHPFLNPWLSTDHQKIYLVDGGHAWIGGMNLGREYRYEWHDLMFELEGPVVTSLEREFRRNWAHESLLGDLAYVVALLTPPKRPTFTADTNRWIELRRLPTRTGWKPFSSAAHGALARAQSYIYVENPYLFDKSIIAGLVKARARGVDVRVVLPRVNDFRAGARGNVVVANYLRQNGVRVYFYPGMTHVKALLVDGWSCLGSGNMTHLSLDISQEQNIGTSDPAVAACLKRDLFEADFARSYELTQPISSDWVDFLADMVLEDF